MVTIIHLPEGSTQPAVYMIQLGGTSPWSLQWGDQPYVMLCYVRLRRALRQGPVGPLEGARRAPMCRVAKSGPVGFGPEGPKPNRPRA